MSDSLDAACEEAMQQPGVVGVMCVDSNGLCLRSMGEVQPRSGSIAEIVRHAEILNSGESSTVSISAAHQKIMLCRSEGVTVAMFMQVS